jgi:hypothetical protein
VGDDARLNRLEALVRQLQDAAPVDFWYDEINGGADGALPNTGAWQIALHADGSEIGGTIIVPDGTEPQLWRLEGNLLVRADSANDTPLKVGILINNAEFAVAHSQRNYYGGGANLQGWTLGSPSRVVELGPGNWAVRLAGLAYTGFGGAYHRGDAKNGGTIYGRRLR